MIRYTALACVSMTAASSLAQIQEVPIDLYQKDIAADMVATVRAALPEARAVGADFLDPTYDAVLRLTEPASVAVTFIDEGAGYRNSLAWIATPPGVLDTLTKGQVDINGNGHVSLNELRSVITVEHGTLAFDYGLVFPNASRRGAGGQLNAGDSVNIADGRVFAQGTEIVFCLLQNAWSSGSVRGFDTHTESTLSMYTLDLLNPEAPENADIAHDSVDAKSRHVAMLFGDEKREQIILGFEDLHRSRNSDEDFNDAILLLSSTPASAISGSNIPSADPAFNPRPTGLFINEDCCNVDTSTILETELPERTNVNADFLNPGYTPTLEISEPTFLVLSFVGEGAIYQNSLGYMTYPAGTLDNLDRDSVDANSNGLIEPWELRAIEGVEIGMVFAHASIAGGSGAIEPREALILGDREFQAGTRIDFFLVQDGWNDNRTVKDYLRDTSSTALTFYSHDAFNPESEAENRRHVAMLFTDESQDSVLFAFEDLHRTDRVMNPGGYHSDEDFNDNVFCVSPFALGALSQTNIPVAGEGCIADHNGDDIINVFDILAFIPDFASRTPAADVNLDGLIDVFDLIDFLDAFTSGCEPSP